MSAVPNDFGGEPNEATVLEIIRHYAPRVTLSRLQFDGPAHTLADDDGRQVGMEVVAD
jgi:hypothetical protein